MQDESTVTHVDDVETAAPTMSAEELAQQFGTEALIIPELIGKPAPMGYVSGTNIPRTRNKVAIIGFAPSSMRDAEALWEDPDCEIWALNQLYMAYPRIVPHVTRWFQFHHRHMYDAAMGRDHKHHDWLAAQTAFPIYMQKKEPDVPMSVPLPKDGLIDYFATRYFTNSISWEIALAIAEGFKTIYIYGVDMAQDEEYAEQRPSCEYFIGVARGRGINVVIPEKSDLLKAMWLYPFEDDSPMRIKMDSRQEELQQRIRQLASQEQECRDAKNQLLGAAENQRYVRKAWISCSREMARAGEAFVTEPQAPQPVIQLQ